MKLIAKKSIKFLLLGATLVVLVAAGFALRILYAPISLPYANDVIAEEAERLAPSLEISFEKAELGWDWGTVRPWTRITGIRVRDIYGRMEGYIPEARVALVREALMSGKFRLREVTLVKPVITIMDIAAYNAGGNEAETDRFVAGNEETGKLKMTPLVLKPAVRVASRFGRRLLQPGEELDSVEIEGGYLAVWRDGPENQAEIILPSARITRGERDLHIEAVTDTRFGDSMITSRLSGNLEPFARQLALSLEVGNISPAEAQPIFQLPEIVGDLEASFHVLAELEADADNGLVQARVKADAVDASLYHVGRFPTRARLKEVRTTLLYKPSSREVEIEDMTLQLQNSLIKVSGDMHWRSGKDRPAIDITANLDRADLGDILVYWPDLKYAETEKRSARFWIEDNIRAVNAHDAEFRFRIDEEGNGAFEDGSPYELTLSFNDTVTGYYKEMPDITGASGTARLTRQTFTLDLETGRIGNVDVSNSHVLLEDIHIKGQNKGTFTVNTSGPLQELLQILDSEPLSLLTKANLSPDQFSGTASGSALITMPLLKGTTVDQMTLKSDVRVSDASADGLIPDLRIHDGQISASLDFDRIELFGEAALEGHKAAFQWTQLFRPPEDPEAPSAWLKTEGGTSPELIALFGADVSEFIDGTAPTVASFEMRGGRLLTGTFESDVTDVSLAASPLGWEKDAGIAGKLSGQLTFLESGLRLSPMHLSGEGMDLVADFTWQNLDQPEERHFLGDVRATKLGENVLRAELEQNGTSPTNAIVTADVVDLRPFLGEKEDEEEAADKKEQEDVRLSLNARKALFLNNTVMNSVDLEAHFTGGEPVKVIASGLGSAGQQVSVIIEDDGSADDRKISISTADGGGLLRGSGLFAHVIGGDFQLEGRTTGWGRDFSIAGEAKMRNYLLRGSSQMDEGVTEGVIAGIDQYVENKDMTFKNLTMPFTFKRGLLDVSGMKANGDSAGITMEGQLDSWHQEINVNGVLVPAYGLNSLLGKIPLIGTILTGGKGKGIISVAWRAKGPMDAPEFNVNPLSGLAPGIFRSIFEGRKGKVKNQERQQIEEEAEQEEKAAKAAASR